MVRPLREALREYLRGWRADLSTAWGSVLDGTEPDLGAVARELRLRDDEVIFPGRRRGALLGAPRGAHVFRSLDGIRPNAVRVVIIGQDPYPKLAQATGRAFEQGDLDRWPTKSSAVAKSLRRIIQSVAVARTGDRRYAANDAAWARVRADADTRLRLQAPREIFDHWQRQGVLFLNSGLTLSRYEQGGAPEQLKGHIPLWKPIVHAIIRHLALRRRGAVVYALWGRPARAVFDSADVEAAAVRNGSWLTRVSKVVRPHPATGTATSSPFLMAENPFEAINGQLRTMGAQPIEW